MKRISPKTKALDDKLAPERRAYVESHRCAGCGGDPCEVHEIIGGWTHRYYTKQHERYWLALCRPCHRKIQYEPKAKQFARKILSDIGPALRERPGVYVEWKDVLKELEELVR